MPDAEPVTAGPTHRRLDQLRAAGVTCQELAAAAGRPPGVIAVLYFLHWVSPATDAAIERAYVALMAKAGS
jgi:hypothetical protein